MIKMKPSSQIKIIDITKIGEYEKYLYKCLVPHPFRRYNKRKKYFEKAIPKGFHKKLLIFDGEIVGQIEYAPAEVSYYPIIGDNVIVMNCIWVLRKAKGHNFGELLLEDMIKSERDTTGFATIALEDHWSPWFMKWQMEKLGFKPLDSIKVTHKTKHKGQVFSIPYVDANNRKRKTAKMEQAKIPRRDNFLYRTSTLSSANMERKHI